MAKKNNQAIHKNKQTIKGKPTGKTGIDNPFRLSAVQYAAGLIAACFAFMLYANTIRNDYALDDYSAVTINRFVQQGFAGIPDLLKVDFWHFSNMKLGYYRPLSLITFAMEYQFFGANPHVSHFFNAMLFAITVFLVFILMSRIFHSMNLLFPLIISLLFAAHPIHTEIVGNIKGRDELLSFLNLMAMLYFATRYSLDKKIYCLVLGILFFYLALLSKETAMMGILLLPLVLFYSGKKSLKQVVLQVLPYIFILFLFFVQKRAALGATPAVVPTDMINYPYAGDAVKYSSAFMLFLFSLRMLVFPHPLRYDYSYNQLPACQWNDPWVLAGLGVFFALIAGSIFLVKQKRIMGFAIGFFLITVIPMMAFTLLRGGIFAERNLFAPSLGFSVAMTLILSGICFYNFNLTELPDNKTSWQSLSRSWSPETFRRLFSGPVASSISLLFLVIIYTGALSTLTIHRNPAWKDSLTLFTTDLKTGEHSAQNQLHYGSSNIIKAVAETDDRKKDSLVNLGMTSIRNALRIFPSFGDAYFRYAYGFEVKMSYQQDMKNVDSAIWYFSKATELVPALSDSYRHLGIIYEWLQRFDVASYYYNKAFEINPTSLEAKAKADELRVTRGLDVRKNPL
jgi:protein O-mannosyl-transferase